MLPLYHAPTVSCRYSNGQDWGLGVLTFLNSTALQWNFRRATDGTVLDTLTLVRKA